MKPTEFIVENSIIAREADDMHRDHEVQMARSQLYSAAQAAIQIHKLLKNVSEMEGLEGWVQTKIAVASEYLESVQDYLKYEAVSQEPEMMAFAESAADYALDQLLMEDDYNDAVKDFLAKGGQVQQGKTHKPRKSERLGGSRHIGGGGEKMKSSRTGISSKPTGKAVAGQARLGEQGDVTAGTGFQQGTSVVKAAPGQIQKDIQASNQLGGTLQNIANLRQGGPNTVANIDPRAQAQVTGMQQAQTDVSKRLAVAGVGQTPTAPQPAQKTDFSQYKDDVSETKSKKLREMATGGSSSAGAVATSMAGPGHKPTSGVPKRVGNSYKSKKVAVGKGIY